MKKIYNNKYNVLRRICHSRFNQSLKDYCSIKIGGVARAVCFPTSIKKLKKLIIVLKDINIKYYIVGFGTNLIFDDGFFDGVIISLTKLSRIFINKNKITALAGVNLFRLNHFCKENCLGGLEWSYGIPGSCGGAVVMNAGCYGKEIKDVADKVYVLHNGKVKIFKNKECKFSYRDSIFKNSKFIILKVVFKLEYKDKELIEKEQKDIYTKRLQSQPYGTKNCGSVFKRIKDESAGKIIDKLGLKGVKIGDIEISQKHANFFINNANATFKDLINMLNFVKDEVYAKCGKTLEEEVIIVRS